MDRDQIFAVIRHHIHAVVEDNDGREIDPSKSMRDYGADSLEIVEVVSRSMKDLGIRVPRTELAEAKNLNDLIGLFERTAAGAATGAVAPAVTA